MKGKDVLKLLKVTRPTLCRYIKSDIMWVETQINGILNEISWTTYNKKNKCEL